MMCEWEFKRNEGCWEAHEPDGSITHFSEAFRRMLAENGTPMGLKFERRPSRSPPDPEFVRWMEEATRG